MARGIDLAALVDGLVAEQVDHLVDDVAMAAVFVEQGDLAIEQQDLAGALGRLAGGELLAIARQGRGPVDAPVHQLIDEADPLADLAQPRVVGEGGDRCLNPLAGALGLPPARGQVGKLDLRERPVGGDLQHALVPGLGLVPALAGDGDGGQSLEGLEVVADLLEAPLP